MSHSGSLLPQSSDQEESTSSQAPAYRPRGYPFGLILTFVGNVLVIAALFSPWIEVFKTDPSLPLAKRGYSPWMVLQRGSIDSLGMVTVVFFLLALGLVGATFVRARTGDTRFRIDSITTALALVGVGVVILALIGIPMGLSLDYPYYDSNIVSGGGLAVVGFLSVLVGVALTRVRRE